jgi:CO dehydrogenase/acetyl-CoA synthase gamma subunit (corrinoid Fe-S protein)
LIDCFEDNVDSCLAEKKDVQIQKVDIDKLFTLAVDKINKTKERLTKTLATPLKKIINTVGEFGLCVKGEFFRGVLKEFDCFSKEIRCRVGSVSLLICRSAKAF